MESPESIGIDRLKARIGVILGAIGSTEKPDSEAHDTKEARRLANEVLQSISKVSKRAPRLARVGVADPKLSASEALILTTLPIDYLVSSVRDDCMEILGLIEGAGGDHTTREKQFVTDALKQLSSANGPTKEVARELYLQVRKRLDTIVASRVALIEATHRFMSTLWLRTLFAVLICSIPVVLFLYKRYWQEDEQSTPPAQATSSVIESSFDVDAAQSTLEMVKTLRTYLEKLPATSVKPKLDLKDIRDFETTLNVDGKFDGFVQLLANLESDAPPEILELAKRVSEVKSRTIQAPQQTLAILSEFRNQLQRLSDLETYLSKKIEQAAETSASRSESQKAGLTRSSDDPIARLATLFSVIIMGMGGAFVSNYSRVCALLKDAGPLGISSVDRSMRVRFSPFLGGLLAVALSEVFGGHLIQGDLFPMTQFMHRWTDLIWHGQAYSKLLVWGFIAGMSEDYVLRILGSLVTKVHFEDKAEKSARP